MSKGFDMLRDYIEHDALCMRDTCDGSTCILRERMRQLEIKAGT